MKYFDCSRPDLYRMPRSVQISLTPCLRGAAAGLTALMLLAPGGARAGEATVELADGRKLEQADLKPGATPEQVVIAPAAGDAVTVTLQDLLVVDFGKVPGRPVIPMVRMANGNQVYGKVSFPAARQVKVSAGWGSITVPLAWCAALRLREDAPLPGPVTRDTLILQTDRVEGEIQGIANGKVTVEVGGKPVAVPVASVVALAMAPRAATEVEREGLAVAVDLGGGERLTGRWLKVDADLLTLQLDWGQKAEIPLASISRLEVKNGKLVYLSDLRPDEVKLTPYLDSALTYRTDLSAAGRPLRLGGKLYSRGLGVRSRSELTYATDGGFQTFAATLGIDDAVGSQGSVIYRVYGDDKLLFESPVARGGDAPREIKIPVRGVLLLRLEVDYADNGDVADLADWADARLLRP